MESLSSPALDTSSDVTKQGKKTNLEGPGHSQGQLGRKQSPVGNNTYHLSNLRDTGNVEFSIFARIYVCVSISHTLIKPTHSLEQILKTDFFLTKVTLRATSYKNSCVTWIFLKIFPNFAV